jgi:hypothetical protein
MIEYDSQYATDVVDLAGFVKNAGPPGGNRNLAVAHMIALRCRLPDDAEWKIVRHSWSEAKAVLASIEEEN